MFKLLMGNKLRPDFFYYKLIYSKKKTIRNRVGGGKKALKMTRTNSKTSKVNQQSVLNL